jgi:hypothetical protein
MQAPSTDQRAHNVKFIALMFTLGGNALALALGGRLQALQICFLHRHFVFA